MLNYDDFKVRVFRVIGGVNSSRTIIEQALHKLEKDFNIPYSIVVNDFNEFNGYDWDI